MNSSSHPWRRRGALPSSAERGRAAEPVFARSPGHGDGFGLPANAGASLGLALGIGLMALDAGAAALSADPAAPGTALVAQATPAGLALLLARPWPAEASPAGFLVSEKFDGVRALWDGRQLRFRGGGLVPAPAWFLARLPSHPLDGELWLGPGRFDELSAQLRASAAEAGFWRSVRYLVFEWPDAPGTFAQRAERLQAAVAALGWPQLQAVPQQPLADAAALQQRLAQVLAAGGEGMMLHRADAPYQTGRGDALFKLKPFDDDDAVVIGHRPGQGRLAGLVGALQVRHADGRQFLIGSGLSDAQRRAPPPLGSLVSYRFRGLTSQGMPRFASMLRVREPGQ